MYLSPAGARTCWTAVAEIGKNVTAVQGDVANLTDLDRLYDEVRKQNRKIDLIFANAGVAQLAPFGNLDEKFYDLHFDANLKGIFFTVQKAPPLLNDGASIILTDRSLTQKASRRPAFIARPRRRSTCSPGPGRTT